MDWGARLIQRPACLWGPGAQEGSCPRPCRSQRVPPHGFHCDSPRISHRIPPCNRRCIPLPSSHRIPPCSSHTSHPATAAASPRAAPTTSHRAAPTVSRHAAPTASHHVPPHGSHRHLFPTVCGSLPAASTRKPGLCNLRLKDGVSSAERVSGLCLQVANPLTFLPWFHSPPTFKHVTHCLLFY